MLKKILCASLITAILSSGACVRTFAKEKINLSCKGDQITVSGICTVCANQQMALRVSLKDADSKDITKIAVLKETKADADGRFLFTFEMPQALGDREATGVYAVYTAGADNHQVIEFEYFNQKSREDVLKILMENQAAAVQQAFADHDMRKKMDGMGIETAIYDTLSDEQKKRAVNSFISHKERTNEMAVVSIMNDCLNVGAYNQATAEEEIYLQALNPVYGEISYIELENTGLKNWQKEYLHENKPYQDKKDMEKAFEQGYAFYEINHARSAGITDKLKEYEDTLQLTQMGAYQRYLNLTAIKRGKAAEKLVSLLASDPVKTTGALEKQIEKAVDFVSDSDKRPVGGGGGSSSSGGINTGLNDYNGIQTPNPPSADNNDAPDANIRFTDIEHVAWAKDAIEALAKKGVIAGTGDGRFLPEDTVKREEFAKMIALAGGFGKEGQTVFSDVAQEQWYAGFIGALADAQIITGRDDGTFGVGANITREDMAVIACRAALKKGKDLSVIREYQNFADDASISGYAKKSVERLYGAGVLNGMDENQFQPKGLCTRAQAAKIVYEIFMK